MRLVERKSSLGALKREHSVNSPLAFAAHVEGKSSLPSPFVSPKFSALLPLLSLEEGDVPVMNASLTNSNDAFYLPSGFPQETDSNSGEEYSTQLFWMPSDVDDIFRNQSRYIQQLEKRIEQLNKEGLHTVLELERIHEHELKKKAEEASHYRKQVEFLKKNFLNIPSSTELRKTRKRKAEPVRAHSESILVVSPTTIQKEKEECTMIENKSKRLKRDATFHTTRNVASSKQF